MKTLINILKWTMPVLVIGPAACVATVIYYLARGKDATRKILEESWAKANV